MDGRAQLPTNQEARVSYHHTNLQADLQGYRKQERSTGVMMLTLLLLMVGTSHAEHNQLTSLFHEILLASDGALQSMVGVTSSDLADIELVYLHRHSPISHSTLLDPHRHNPLSLSTLHDPTQQQHQSFPSTLDTSGTRKRLTYPPLTSTTTVLYSLTAFHRSYQLQLHPSLHLVSPRAVLVVVGNNRETVNFTSPTLSPPSDTPTLVNQPSNSPSLIPSSLCYYTHVDQDITAAFDACIPDTLTGYLVSSSVRLEVRPLGHQAMEAVHHALNKRGGGKYTGQGVPHLVQRRLHQHTTDTTTTTDPQTVYIPSNSGPDVHNIHTLTPGPQDSDVEFEHDDIFTIPPEVLLRGPFPPPQMIKKRFGNKRGKHRQSKPMKGFNREAKPKLFDAARPFYNHLTPPARSYEGAQTKAVKTLELGVFMDKAAHDLFMPYFGSTHALTSFILTYINGLQALFYHPSLGERIRLVINHMELMSQQPVSFPHHQGHREKLYESFRLYDQRRKAEVTNEINGISWDMGLLLSGHNFYTIKNPGDKPSFFTMGLAAVHGVCVPGYSVVLGELGATNVWGHPYPTAGFTSLYVMAHEIGHRNGYIMSASRSTTGETTWSNCSRQVLQDSRASCLGEPVISPPNDQHDHSRYRQLPGQSWDAYDQCQVFLRDPEATLYNQTLDHLVCESVKCQSPNRIGFFKAGPALDGTFCGNNKVCVAGQCQQWPGVGPSPPVVEGGWSPWEQTPCISGCLENGTGVQVSRRTCTHPKPLNSNLRCPGSSFNLTFCDDSQLCEMGRMSVLTYANEKCNEFSSVVKDLTPVGSQAPHNPERQWQACAVFCKRTSGTWYSPRTDLSYLPHYDTYFPDGTPCHHHAGLQYYCQRRQCLPQGHGEREGKALATTNKEWDHNIYQNAKPTPSNLSVPVQVAKMFELNQNMDPLNLEPLGVYHKEEEEENLWEDNDYLHI
ncbi:hypothetical protein Pmani_007920 [Petrolisthes manimaculis]|uniref:Peptidase M12B domain-containing protein n=1 Tax=Petrolisthes manimaculis TaxID=1843537 RepID=A0AAE1Q7Y7_9EUCA|nr:hypothetical protein Pmani_007920 [Petrolisthes manimaculis]